MLYVPLVFPAGVGTENAQPARVATGGPAGRAGLLMRAADVGLR